ncbi:MAG: ABC transporter permease [Elusimicrobia bacterium]|nr:ABC transporter permease [Elusimicrobiota bacterium]
MTTYLLRRLLYLIPTLWGITVLSWGLMQLAPGGPLDQMVALNVKVSPEVKVRLTRELGLDQPWYVQYGRWLKRLSRLDFGQSFKDGQPVLRKIATRLPATLLLNSLAIGVILLVAVPLGVYAAVRQGGWFDRLTTIWVFIGYSTPAFWLALLLMILLGLKLGWLPISRLTSLGFPGFPWWGKAWDLLRHLVLPVFVLAFTGLAGLSRYTRASMLEVIRQDYIRTARAKGLRESRVIIRHALRNALIPILTLLGFIVPDLIGGSVIVETIFAYPGMGRLSYEAIMTRDYFVVMGVVVISAFLTVLGNLLADLSYAYADPRIRYR